jgi:probable phosphoglycerate mutase
MVTLLLVRHGEAEGNREDRFIGQSDVPLTPEGLDQAAVLAGRLQDVPLTRVVSSDLGRCIDTVAPAAASRGLTVEPDPRLREIANGEWGGLLGAEIAAGWPDLFRRYRAGEDVHRPGGERWADVAARVVEALQSAAGDHGGTVLVGTHAGPIAAAARWAAGLPAVGNVFRSGFGPAANASITTITLPGPRLVAYNDAGRPGAAETTAGTPRVH